MRTRVTVQVSTSSSIHGGSCSEVVCRLAQCAGHVYRLHGNTLRAVQCWTLVLRHAVPLRLHHYILTGWVRLG